MLKPIQTKRRKVDAQTIIILILTGLAAGMLGGLVGIGGGIVIVPALVYLLGMSQLAAQGTSLSLLMFPVGVLGVMQYYKAGHVDFRLVAFLAAGFLIGSYVGGRFTLSLPQAAVRKIFAIFMIIIAVKMLFFDKSSKDDKNVTAVSR